MYMEYLPLITSPIPIRNLNGLPRSRDESNFLPLVRVPEREREGGRERRNKEMEAGREMDVGRVGGREGEKTRREEKKKEMRAGECKKDTHSTQITRSHNTRLTQHNTPSKYMHSYMTEVYS